MKSIKQTASAANPMSRTGHLTGRLFAGSILDNGRLSAMREAGFGLRELDSQGRERFRDGLRADPPANKDLEHVYSMLFEALAELDTVDLLARLSTVATSKGASK